MPLTSQAQAVVDAFGTRQDVTAQQLQNLKTTIGGSPYLMEQLNEVVRKGEVLSIVPAPGGGGQYSPRTKELRLPLAVLNTPAGRAYHTGDATCILGHELQHGLNAGFKAAATHDFGQQLRAIATSASFPHDYTTPIANIIEASRVDEAMAEISSWNATVSASRKDAADHGRPAPTLADIYAREPARMSFFIDVDNRSVPRTYSLKPNLEIDPANLDMAVSVRNLKGMGENYFDQNLGGLGYRGTSNYRNFYGANAISNAVIHERLYNPPRPGQSEHEIRIDMTALQLSPRIVAENGLDFRENRNPIAYVDGAGPAAKRAVFQHTNETHTYTEPTTLAVSSGGPGAPRMDDAARGVPVAAAVSSGGPGVPRTDDASRGVPVAAAVSSGGPGVPRTDDASRGVPVAAAVSSSSSGVPRLDHATHPDHGLYRQALGAVQRLYAQENRTFDAGGDNLAAAVTVQARRDGLSALDLVMFSDDRKKMFGVQGDSRSLFKKIAEVDVEKAIVTTVEQSSQQWLEAGRSRVAQAPPLDQQQTPSPARQM